MKLFFMHCISLISVAAMLFCQPIWALDEDELTKEPSSDIASTDQQALSFDELKIPTVSFHKVEGQPVLDGKLSEPFWKKARRFDLDLELYPTRFAKPIVETVAYIAVTSTHVFVGFVVSDPNPEKLRSAPRNHDAVKDDDYVSLIIDPTGTAVKKYEFRINPHGSLADVLQDTVSDRYIYDWDTKWSGAADINDKGYTAEIAIPLQSIKFPLQADTDDGKWLMVLKRSYPRRVDRTFGAVILVEKTRSIEKEKETNLLSSIEKQHAIDKSNDDQPGLALEESEVEAVMPAAKATLKNSRLTNRLQSLEITPYYIFHRDEERDVGASFEQVDEHSEHEVGFTGNMRFGTNKSLAITINPNFTEVEADIARDSINNSFVKFKPEKREFFQANGELYNTMLPVVYTRHVVSPEVGFSYAQSDKKSTSGFFWANDRETELIMPDSLGSDTVSLLRRSESAAARYQRVFGKQAVGLLGTFRQGDGYHNYLGGVDGVWDLGIDDKMRYQLLYADTKYPEAFADDLCEEGDCTVDPIPEDCSLGHCNVNAYVLRTDPNETLADHALRFNYKHDGPTSLYWFNYYDVGEDFRGDLGYTARIDFKMINFAYGHKWYLTMPGDDGKSRIRAYFVLKDMESQRGEQIDESISLFAEFRGWQQTVLRFGPTVKERAVNRLDQNSLSLGDNAPLFDENYWTWYYEIAPSVKWTLNFDGRYGEIADAENMLLGDMREFKPRFRYRFDDHIEVDAKLTWRKFDVSAGELYTEKFYTLSASYRKNKKISHRLLWLYDVTERNLENWVVDEDKKERESSFEYTFIYMPNNYWKLLAGVKFLNEWDDDINEDGLTNREFYLKIERQINVLL